MNRPAPYEWGSELPTLTGRVVGLRALHEDDAESVYSIFSDPAVMRFWSSPPLENLEAARQLIREIRTAFQNRQLFQWGVTHRESDEVVGTCTLFHLDPEHRRAELGFALRRSSWGQGLAAAAVAVLLEFAFETLRLHRIEADVDPENERSLHLLERQGFRREGHLRERWHHMGSIRDGVMLGLLRREWVSPRLADSSGSI